MATHPHQEAPKRNGDQVPPRALRRTFYEFIPPRRSSLICSQGGLGRPRKSKQGTGTMAAPGLIIDTVLIIGLCSFHNHVLWALSFLIHSKSMYKCACIFLWLHILYCTRNASKSLKLNKKLHLMRNRRGSHYPIALGLQPYTAVH